MGFIFISHSSLNNEQAIEVNDWLHEHGWRDTFLDLDPEHGLAPGQRWQEELKKAGERCSAVVVLISPQWVASRWCQVEFLLAAQLGKRIFGIIIAPTPFDDLPIELTAHYQLVDISDPAKKADGFERLRFGLKRAGLDAKDFSWPPPDEPARSPYRGLRSLEEKDAAVFFGRDAPITRGLDALRRLRDGAPERLLVILGASGAGKSSFLKAGLLARLQRDEEHFLVLPTVRPERAALSGPRGLLCALGLSARPTETALGDRLAEIRRPVVERLQRYAEAAHETYAARPPTLILPIDQAEELFSSDNIESAAALDLLSELLAVDPDLVAVLTLRSDSFSRLQGEPRLVEVPRLPFDLPRLSPGAFKEVIEGPGRLAEPEIRFDPALTERLMVELDSADALPLLAFTLERLIAEYGGDGKLELHELVDGLGGIAGAIDQAVEKALAAAGRDPALPNQLPALEALARRAFLPWLVSVDDADAPPKRRVARMSELPVEARKLARHLVDQRLLVSDTREDETTVEVSHEAVLRHWRALAVWIDEERDALRTLDAVQAAAKEWEQKAADGGSGETWLVHRGERLTGAEKLLGRSDYRQLLGDAGRDYLSACRRREDAERVEAEERVAREQKHLERQRRLQRRAALALLLVAVAVAGFAIFALKQSRTASGQISLVLTDYARRAIEDDRPERALRLAALAAREGLLDVADPAAAPALAAAAHRSSLIVELRRHPEPIRDVELSSDGQLLLTRGRTARVWDVATGAEIAVPKAWSESYRGIEGALSDAAGRRLSWKEAFRKEDGAWVWDAGTVVDTTAVPNRPKGDKGAIFDASGERVLSWDWDGNVRVQDATTGAEIAATKHRDTVGGAVFDPSGRRVLSWSDDGTVRVWDAATGAEIAATDHEINVWGAMFDAAGERVLSWGYGGIMRVWDAATGAEIAGKVHEHTVDKALFDPSGKRVLFWETEGDASLWNVVTGVEIALSKKHLGPVKGAMFDATGEHIISWNSEGIVRLSDPATGVATREVRGTTFDSAGERVLSWTRGGLIRVSDAVTGEEIVAWQHEGPVWGAMFDAAGKRVLSWGEKTAWVWNAATGEKIAASQHGSLVDGAMFNAAGERILSWTRDGTARVWNAATGEEITATKHEGSVDSALFDAAGERVLSWSSNGTVRVWNAATGVMKQKPWDSGNGEGAAFDAAGERVLSWSDGGSVRLWDATTGVEIAATKHEASVEVAVLDPAGERVLSWDNSGVGRLWDVVTGTELAVLRRDDDNVLDVVFDPSGERLLSMARISFDGVVRLWDLTTGAEIANWMHLEGDDLLGWEFGERVVGAVFDATGERGLSWGFDGIARVWDPATGAELATLRHEGKIQGAMFDASGEQVLTLNNGTTRFWDVSWSLPRPSNQALIDEVCARKLRGTEVVLSTPFVNGNGETITHESVRRITAADADFAPILRDRVGEDVCAPQSWWRGMGQRLLRLLPGSGKSF